MRIISIITVCSLLLLSACDKNEQAKLSIQNFTRENKEPNEGLVLLNVSADALPIVEKKGILGSSIFLKPSAIGVCLNKTSEMQMDNNFPACESWQEVDLNKNAFGPYVGIKNVRRKVSVDGFYYKFDGGNTSDHYVFFMIPVTSQKKTSDFGKIAYAGHFKLSILTLPKEYKAKIKIDFKNDFDAAKKYLSSIKDSDGHPLLDSQKINSMEDVNLDYLNGAFEVDTKTLTRIMVHRSSAEANAVPYIAPLK